MNHKDTQNMVFLLGGHDLEMMTIREMLESNHVCFVDNGLNWNSARLSAYENAISSNPEADFYGIELQEDYPLPRHYTRIDHHNDYNNRPASILQVADLISINPDRRLLLVAANDSGYIPAMVAMGATQEEINNIRLEDRSAQGVTDDDEIAAEQSIARGLSRIGDTIIVRSQTSRFSPICDRLYPYRRLLIYNDTKWVFYGDGKKELATMMVEEIKTGRIYHGGGDTGYIGAARGVFNSHQIMDFVSFIQQKYESL